LLGGWIRSIGIIWPDVAVVNACEAEKQVRSRRRASPRFGGREAADPNRECEMFAVRRRGG